MKRQLFVTLLAAGLMTGGAARIMAQAPATSGLKMGLINVQAAIFESAEGKQATAKLQTQFAPKRNDLLAKQGEVERLQKQLREQEKTLSDEARSSLVRQIETKTKELNRAEEDFTNEGQQAQAQVFNDIGTKMMKVVDEFARKNGYHVVMDVGSPQTPVIWASETVNITDDIVKLYDAANPAAGAGEAAPAGAPPAGAKPAGAKPATPPASKPAAPAAPAAKQPGAKKP